MRTATLADVGLKDPKQRSAKNPADLTKQAQATRVFVRQNDYLTYPQNYKHISTISGQLLDQDLLSFVEKGWNMRANYVDAFIDHFKDPNPGQNSVNFNETPLFITQEDRENYNKSSNKTIVQLKQDILQKLKNSE